jgi:hypothetical protein
MPKKNLHLSIFLTGFLMMGLTACSTDLLTPSTPDHLQQNDHTPTVTLVGGLSTAKAGDDLPLPTNGTLEISFIDGLIRELCIFSVPITIEWGDEQSIVTGETEALCALNAVQCGDACVTMNSDWELEVSLAGTVYMGAEDAPSGEIHADFVFSGILKNYASDWPPGAIPGFTMDQPFVIEQPGTILPLVIALEDGATTQLVSAAGGEPMDITLHLSSR